MLRLVYIVRGRPAALRMRFAPHRRENVEEVGRQCMCDAKPISLSNDTWPPDPEGASDRSGDALTMEE